MASRSSKLTLSRWRRLLVAGPFAAAFAACTSPPRLACCGDPRAPSAEDAARSELDAFLSPEVVGWRSPFAYFAGTSSSDGQAYVVKMQIDAQTRTLTPIFALAGDGLSRFVAQGDAVVLRAENGLSLYRHPGSPPLLVPGNDAVFTPDGRRLLTFDTEQLELVDVATGQRRAIPIGATVEPRGEFAGGGRLFVSSTGGLACREDSATLAVVDLETARVRLLTTAGTSEVSASKRYFATVAIEPANHEPRSVIRIWELEDLDKAPVRADLGPSPGTPSAIQFDAEERRVVVSACGAAGAGHFSGFVSRISVGVSDGKLRPPPPAPALPPRDSTERWERLAPSFASRVRPRRLVATERGPGRFESYAENGDASRVALLAGEVSAGEIQTVSDPVLFVFDQRAAKTARPAHLATTNPGALFTSGVVAFSPPGTHVFVCLEGETLLAALFDVRVEKMTAVELRRPCVEWSFSADGTALTAAGEAWEVETARPFQVPFAKDEAEARRRLSRAARDTRDLPSWLLCRKGPALTPASACF